MYSVLECFSDPEGGMAVVVGETVPEVDSWFTGLPLDVPADTVIELFWDEETEDQQRLSFYSAGPVLMHRDLVRALQDAGVDNLDLRETLIQSPTGKDPCKDYLAVGIVGLVAAVDHEASQILPVPGSGPLIDCEIESLAIDGVRAHDLPLFRLAECVSAVLLHDSVRAALEKCGGFGLSFVPPAEWSG